jgi:hypothetical protein
MVRSRSGRSTVLDASPCSSPSMRTSFSPSPSSLQTPLPTLLPTLLPTSDASEPQNEFAFSDSGVWGTSTHISSVSILSSATKSSQASSILWNRVTQCSLERLQSYIPPADLRLSHVKHHRGTCNKPALRRFPKRLRPPTRHKCLRPGCNSEAYSREQSTNTKGDMLLLSCCCTFRYSHQITLCQLDALVRVRIEMLLCRFPWRSLPHKSTPPCTTI